MDKALKQAAIAYIIANEWDYCPDQSNIDKVIDFLGETTEHIGDDPLEVVTEILDKYSGSRPDEIANIMIEHILHSKEKDSR